MNHDPLSLHPLASTLTVALAAFLLGGCVAPAATAIEDGARSSSEDRGSSVPPAPASLVGDLAGSGADSCTSDSDCRGVCVGQDVLCCPACGAGGFCGMLCEPTGPQTPPAVPHQHGV